VDAGYQIRRHIFANASFSKWNYPAYGGVSGFDARRLMFGITFASRDYPLPY
jgi:hypothetical protein